LPSHGSGSTDPIERIQIRIWIRNPGKTAFVKFKISNNFDEACSKQPKFHRKIHQPTDLNHLKKNFCELKVSRLLPNVCDFPKENHTLGIDLKIYRKSKA
jgi:hypothetical protein